MSKRVCTCCGQCCIRHPCAPFPAELTAIAKAWKLSCWEFFQHYMMMDYWIETDGTYRYFPIFAREGDTPGQETPFKWAFEQRPCVFLSKNKLCLIHCFDESLKPKQARDTFCFTQNDARIGNDEIAKAWQDDPLLKRWYAETYP